MAGTAAAVTRATAVPVRRLTFVVTGLGRGGAETQLVRIATHLQRVGWTVDIVTLIALNDFAPTLEASGIAVRPLGMRRGRFAVRALPDLVRLLRAQKPTIVCTFMYHANVLGRIAAKLAGVPVVVSSVRNSIFGGAWADRSMAWTDRLCTVTTTNSELAAAALVERSVARPDRLRVIPNGIDTDAMNELPRERAWLDELLDLRAPTFVWVSVGRLEPQKGQDTLLGAVAKLSTGGHRMHCVFVGDGSERAALTSSAAALGVTGDVTFLGFRSDVARLMRASDAFVLASNWEGLPNAVMEALVARLPVVATRVGGVPELVEDGRTGILVPSKDPASLADAMTRVMSLSDQERSRLTQRALEHVRDRFSLASVMAMWEALFEELLAGRSRHREPLRVRVPKA